MVGETIINMKSTIFGKVNPIISFTASRILFIPKMTPSKFFAEFLKTDFIWNTDDFPKYDE